jgi:hypothetical protein
MTNRIIIRLIAALAVLAMLAGMLVAAANAEDGKTETDYALRLQRAREKYNEKTVNVYRKGWGYIQSKKINVCFYKSPKEKYYAINIRESLKITDEAEMEAILEVIMQNEYYDEAVYGDMAFMKAQWITHNIAYELANGNPETRRLVSTLAGETAVKVAQRARELDLSPICDMSEKELALTEKIMELFPAQQIKAEGNPQE